MCPQDLEVAAMTYAPYPVPEVVSEDCLYLNIWSPSLDEGKAANLPVMVWIHGGSYIQGIEDAMYTTTVMLSLGREC